MPKNLTFLPPTGHMLASGVSAGHGDRGSQLALGTVMAHWGVQKGTLHVCVLVPSSMLLGVPHGFYQAQTAGKCPDNK